MESIEQYIGYTVAQYIVGSVLQCVVNLLHIEEQNIYYIYFTLKNDKCKHLSADTCRLFCGLIAGESSSTWL